MIALQKSVGNKKWLHMVALCCINTKTAIRDGSLESTIKHVLLTSNKQGVHFDEGSIIVSLPFPFGF
jgi:hypothetical protein